MRLDHALRDDHQALEVTFERVLRRFHGGDSEAIRTAWLALDEELEAHLKAEERFILPEFAKSFPVEAQRIERDHQRIRAALVELGIDLDLHLLREHAAERFVQTLREHAQYEDEVFYAWAETSLSERAQHAAIAHLRAAGGSTAAEEPTRGPAAEHLHA